MTRARKQDRYAFDSAQASILSINRCVAEIGSCFGWITCRSRFCNAVARVDFAMRDFEVDAGMNCVPCADSPYSTFEMLEHQELDVKLVCKMWLLAISEDLN